MATPRNTVQYRDMGQVLRAYDRLDIPCCAIFHGKQLMFPIDADDTAEGSNMLREILQDLQTSPAIYTLAMYRQLPKGELTDTTPYSASFNFRLCEYSSNGSPGGLPVPGGDYNAGKDYMQAIQTFTSEINALRTEVKALREEWEAEEDEEPQAVNQPVIEKSMQEKFFAGLEPLIPQIGQKLVDKIFPGTVTKIPAGINGSSVNELTEDQKRATALTRLEKNVKDLGDKLLKLADLADQDAEKFNNYLGLFFG